MCVASVYLVCNSAAKAKMLQINIDILGAVGDRCRASGYPMVIAGDFNTEVSVIKSDTNFLESFSLEVGQPDSLLGSCVSRRGLQLIRSNLDYFLVSRNLWEAVEGSRYCMDTPPRPHRPALLMFNDKAKNVDVLVFSDPPKIPPKPPFES